MDEGSNAHWIDDALSIILHPAQFHDIWTGDGSGPEHRLAVAILDAAGADLRTYRFARRVRGQRLYWSTYQWIASNNRQWPYSFLNLCEFCGIEPTSLRRALLMDGGLSRRRRHRCVRYGRTIAA